MFSFYAIFLSFFLFKIITFYYNLVLILIQIFDFCKQIVFIFVLIFSVLRQKSIFLSIVCICLNYRLIGVKDANGFKQLETSSLVFSVNAFKQFVAKQFPNQTEDQNPKKGQTVDRWPQLWVGRQDHKIIEWFQL